MEMDHNSAKQPASTNLAPLFGVTLAAMIVFAIGAYALRSASIERGNGDCYEQELPPGEQGPNPFTKWDKPLVALVLSGQMHGYYDPCGCSKPMHGGLTRRFNFVQALKAKDWDVVGIDLGELPGLKGIHAQNLLKHEMSVKALAAMNYRAFGIGVNETLLPLGEGLAQIWDKKRAHPRPLNLNLDQNARGKLFDELNVRGYEIINTTPKLGVISMMGPDLRDDLAKQEKFLKTMQELPKALQAFADAGVKIGIILHHEYPHVDEQKFPKAIKYEQEVIKQRRARALECAKFCADARAKNDKIPPIELMMVLTNESLAPSLMSRLDDKLETQVVEIGHKGKYVGLVGVYKDKGSKKYRLHYELVDMNEDWLTKKGKEKDNAVIGLVEIYNQELKRANMLAKFPRSPHYNQIPLPNDTGLRATYVGSDRCFDCHNDAYNVWKDTPHFKATKTLEDEVNPSGRQYDPECMMCHTTGLKHPGGYNDLVVNPGNWPAKPPVAPTPKQVQKHNDNLRGVGCESCHGPASEHVKNTKDKDWLKLINPYRPSKEERDLEDKEAKRNITPKEKQQLDHLFRKRMDALGPNLCMKCHDDENDVNYGRPGNDTADKWRAGKHPLIHRTPPVVIEIIQNKKK